MITEKMSILCSYKIVNSGACTHVYTVRVVMGGELLSLIRCIRGCKGILVSASNFFLPPFVPHLFVFFPPLSDICK